MKEIDLSHFACFRKKETVAELNRLVEVHAELIPRQLAVQTGCELQDALTLLLLLSDSSAARPSLLVYHRAYPDAHAFARRDIYEGPPALPVVCDVCGQKVTDRADLGYEFLFETTDRVRFVVTRDDS